MKTLKVAICAIFVLFAGLVFGACGEKKDFDASKIVVNEINSFVFDGNVHAVEVSYPGVDISVEYSLESNGNYVTLNELEVSDVGTYKVYYKIYAKGYNEYFLSKPVDVTITPRDVEIQVQDFNYIKSADNDILPAIMISNTVPGDEIGLEYDAVNFDKTTAEYGDEFVLTCGTNNPNYNLNVTPATMLVTDYAKTVDGAGNVTNYYTSVQNAINNLAVGEKIVLDANSYVDNTINVSKSVVIDGQGRYTIQAKANSEELVSARKLINVSTEGVELTLKDVTIDAAQICRVVYVSAGKLIIDGATIQNGKTINSYIGGVYITGTAIFEMTSGKIINNYCSNHYSTDNYLQYSADLWIGSQATGTLSSVTGGEIGNVFINANEYSKSGAGFKLDGGKIGTVYVEYNEGNAARFDYVQGEISKLLISTNHTSLSHEFIPVENTESEDEEIEM